MPLPIATRKPRVRRATHLRRIPDQPLPWTPEPVRPMLLLHAAVTVLGLVVLGSLIYAVTVFA